MIGILHKFELTDNRTFKLPSDNGFNITHLATIKWKLREFVYFRIDQTSQTYIEEVILKPTAFGGNITAVYQRLDDDNLWRDLAEFLTEKGLTNMSLPYLNPYK
jgi:hypothetical protein